jgi:hypothetical protein
MLLLLLLLSLSAGSAGARATASLAGRVTGGAAVDAVVKPETKSEDVNTPQEYTSIDFYE